MDRIKALSFVVLIAVIIAIVLLLDYVGSTGIYREESRVGFTCYEHNYTITDIEPMTRYVCMFNQSCVTFCDMKGDCAIIIHTECIRSYAVLGDNSTVWCNGTVEDCEDVYNNGGYHEERN